MSALVLIDTEGLGDLFILGFLFSVIRGLYSFSLVLYFLSLYREIRILENLLLLHSLERIYAFEECLVQDCNTGLSYYLSMIEGPSQISFLNKKFLVKLLQL